MRSRTINELLKKAIVEPDREDQLGAQIASHDRVLRELIDLARLLAQEQVSIIESKPKDAQKKALKKRLQQALGVLHYAGL